MKWSLIPIGLIATLEVAAAKTSAPATTAPPTTAPPLTKDIQLNTNIMPTWNDLGTKPKTKKIKLKRVFKYWAALETRDKKAIKALYATTSEQNAASNKVDDYYDGAKTCLKKQKETVRKTHAEIDQGLAEVAKCIQDEVTPPTFTVLASASLPDSYNDVISIDFDDYNKDDDADDEVEAKATTASPVMTTAAPVVTTTAPPATTAAPVVTTAAPVVTSAPEVTTAAPTMPGAETTPLNNEPEMPGTEVTASNGMPGTEVTASNGMPGTEVSASNTEPTMPGSEATVSRNEATMPGSEVLASNDEPTMPGSEGTESQDEPTMPGSEITESQDEPTMPGSEITESQDEPTMPGSAITESPIEPTMPGSEVTASKDELPMSGSEVVSSNDEPMMPGSEITESQYEPTMPGAEVTASNDEPMPGAEVETSQDEPAMPGTEVKVSNDAPTMPGAEVTSVSNNEPSESGGNTFDSETVTNDDVTALEPVSEESPVVSTHVNGEPAASDAVAPGPETHELPLPVNDEPALLSSNDVLAPASIVGESGEVPSSIEAPYEETAPAVIDVLPPMIARTPEWPFSPASPDVPPMWALDLDQSSTISGDEWAAYVMRLHALATKAAQQGRDLVAVKLLEKIIDFHYATLGHCITDKLEANGVSELHETNFDHAINWIQANCYVKFRYSLFAGVPPFEWIAKDAPTVPAAEIEKWFADKVETARIDLQVKQIVSLAPENQELVEKFIGCTFAMLNQAGDAVVDRGAYYDALRRIEACAEQ